MNKINIAIIGCGRVGIHHSKAILKNKKLFNFKAICDLDISKCKNLNNSLGTNLPYYSDYKKMLKESDIDIVSIITPSGMHYFQATEIIQKFKKNLIIEKPFVMKVAQGKNLISLAKKHNVNIFPVFQYRYNLSVQRVKKAIEKKQLGKIFLSTIRTRWNRGQNYYDRDIWRGTFSHDGGALTNQGIHHLDLMRYLNGEVKSVFAKSSTNGSKIEVEDTMIAILEFMNGSQGIIEITTAARPRDFESSLSFLGDKGTAIIGGWATNQISEFSYKPSDKIKYSEKFDDVYGFGHIKLYREIGNFLLFGKNYLCKVEDALKSINLLHAIYLSSQRKRKVKVSNNMNFLKLGKINKKINSIYS